MAINAPELSNLGGFSLNETNSETKNVEILNHHTELG